MNIKLVIVLFIIFIPLILIGCTGKSSVNVSVNESQIEEDFYQVAKNNILNNKSNVERDIEKLLTIDDLNKAFHNAELNLKPQADDGFLTNLILNDVKPINYELLDDGVYFYIFKNQQDVRRGLNEIVDLPYSFFQSNTEIYSVKNALIFYKISRGNELEREQYKLKIKEVVEDLYK